jgi:hypothetical protein
VSKIGCKIETVGPFHSEYYQVTIDGYQVPKLKALKRSGAQDGIITLVLDGRLAIDIADDQLDPWLWLVANAMAIGAGYSCFGENSVKDPNPFKVKLLGLGEVESE